MKEIKVPKLVAANEENMSVPTELFEKTKKRIDEVYKCTEGWEQSRFVLKIVELENWAVHYREVIDKAIEYISELDDNTDDTTCYDIDKYTRDYILNILKEVE